MQYLVYGLISSLLFFIVWLVGILLFLSLKRQLGFKSSPTEHIGLKIGFSLILALATTGIIFLYFSDDTRSCIGDIVTFKMGDYIIEAPAKFFLAPAYSKNKKVYEKYAHLSGKRAGVLKLEFLYPEMSALCDMEPFKVIDRRTVVMLLHMPHSVHFSAEKWLDSSHMSPQDFANEIEDYKYGLKYINFRRRSPPVDFFFTMKEGKVDWFAKCFVIGTEIQQLCQTYAYLEPNIEIRYSFGRKHISEWRKLRMKINKFQNKIIKKEAR